jgi:hypothetical protein
LAKKLPTSRLDQHDVRQAYTCSKQVLTVLTED